VVVEVLEAKRDLKVPWGFVIELAAGLAGVMFGFNLLGFDVEGCIFTGEFVPFRVTQPGSESGKHCGIGRVITDLRGASNEVEVGLVGESDGLLVERSLGGAIVASMVRQG